MRGSVRRVGGAEPLPRPRIAWWGMLVGSLLLLAGAYLAGAHNVAGKLLALAGVIANLIAWVMQVSQGSKRSRQRRP